MFNKENVKISMGQRGLAAALVIAPLSWAGSALAAEPKGCNAFKWPLQHEAELLLRADKPQLPSGAAAKLEHAYDLKLAPFDKAQLPTPPERMPKTSDSTAGFVTFEAPAAGSYQITLTDGAWIDIVQAATPSSRPPSVGPPTAPGCAKASASLSRRSRSPSRSAASTCPPSGSSWSRRAVRRSKRLRRSAGGEPSN